MENMLLAATALGLGGCWMTGPLDDEKYLRGE
ncbi:nitroreductase family protein [Sporomusa sphaeroides]